MKKGLSYIDWSVSAAIFVISIIGIFVLFSPAFRQDPSPEYLGEIVKDGLEETITLEIYRYPIYVDVDTSKSGAIQLQLVNVPSEVISEIEDSNYKFIVYTSTGVPIINKVYSGGTIFLSTTYSDLGISGPVTETTLYLYVSKEEIFPDSGIGGTPATLGNVFGIGETLKGVYIPYFTSFENSSYEDAKETLNYPKDNDFSVEIYNGTDLSVQPILNYTKAFPAEDDRVDVLLWSYWSLDSTTKREPITVLIKTW